MMNCFRNWSFPTDDDRLLLSRHHLRDYYIICLTLSHDMSFPVADDCDDDLSPFVVYSFREKRDTPSFFLLKRFPFDWTQPISLDASLFTFLKYDEGDDDHHHHLGYFLLMPFNLLPFSSLSLSMMPNLWLKGCTNRKCMRWDFERRTAWIIFSPFSRDLRDPVKNGIYMHMRNSLVFLSFRVEGWKRLPSSPLIFLFLRIALFLCAEVNDHHHHLIFISSWLFLFLSFKF